MKTGKLTNLEVFLVATVFVLAMFVFAGYKDIQFLGGTTPKCECRYDLIVCQQMNRNATKLLKRDILNIRIR